MGQKGDPAGVEPTKDESLASTHSGPHSGRRTRPVCENNTNSLLGLSKKFQLLSHVDLYTRPLKHYTGHIGGSRIKIASWLVCTYEDRLILS